MKNNWSTNFLIRFFTEIQGTFIRQFIEQNSDDCLNPNSTHNNHVCYLFIQCHADFFGTLTYNSRSGFLFLRNCDQYVTFRTSAIKFEKKFWEYHVFIYLPTIYVYIHVWDRTGTWDPAVVQTSYSSYRKL